MGRMVSMNGPSSLKEVDMVKDGEWNTKCVFTIRYMWEIVSVEGELGARWISQW